MAVRVTIASSCDIKASSCEPMAVTDHACLLDCELLSSSAGRLLAHYNAYLHDLFIAAEFFLSPCLLRGLLFCLSACLQQMRDICTSAA